MAKPTTLAGAKVLIMIGDGAGPEVFTAPCGLSTRGINFSKETNDVTVPDCDDPDAAAWVDRLTTSFSSTISGSGLLAKEAVSTWRAFFESSLPKNCRVKLDGGSGWGYWSGAYLLTTFNVGGDRGELATVEIELISTGTVTWTATA